MKGNLVSTNSSRTRIKGSVTLRQSSFRFNPDCLDFQVSWNKNPKNYQSVLFKGTLFVGSERPEAIDLKLVRQMECTI